MEKTWTLKDLKPLVRSQDTASVLLAARLLMDRRSEWRELFRPGHGYYAWWFEHFRKHFFPLGYSHAQYATLNLWNDKINYDLRLEKLLEFYLAEED